MHPLMQRLQLFFYSTQGQWLLRISILLMLCAMSHHAWADDNGKDLLKGDDASFWATYGGTLKNLLYGIEGIVAIASYIKTKNLLVFGGIIAIALFINIVFKLAGVAT